MEVSSPACPAATHSTNDGPLIMSATTLADYLQRPVRVPSNVARVAVIAAWRAFIARQPAMIVGVPVRSIGALVICDDRTSNATTLTRE
jgi:hypothetical protein